MCDTDYRKYLINTAINTALAMPTRLQQGRMLPSCVKFCQGRQEKMREGRENPAGFAPSLASALSGLRGARRGQDRDIAPQENVP